MKVLQTANLGSGLGGVSGSIRYALYDTLGAEKVSSTNSGIYELGSSTGLYGVELDLSTQFSGSIVWSVNGNSSLFNRAGVASIDELFERKLVGTGSV